MRLVYLTEGAFRHQYIMPDWLAFLFVRYFNTDYRETGQTATIHNFYAYYDRHVPTEFKVDKVSSPAELIKEVPLMVFLDGTVKDQVVSLN